jgi:hypothetical protein
MFNVARPSGLEPPPPFPTPLIYNLLQFADPTQPADSGGRRPAAAKDSGEGSRGGGGGGG